MDSSGLKRLVSLVLALTFFCTVKAEDSKLVTVTAEYREIPREFRLDGLVEAIHQTTVSAQTQGEVRDILFDINDYVEKGTVIIVLKDAEQKARVSRAEADLREATARMEQAKEDFARTRDLYKKKLMSQAKMDEATAGLKAASAKHEASSSSLTQAREQYEYTRVKAPYSGIVTHRHVEVGEVAKPGDKLMTGLSLDRLRVIVDVPQSLIPVIRKIGKAKVQQPGDGYVDATKLTIFPFAHHGSNTFQVRLDLPEGASGMFPGMFVKTAFVTGAKKEIVIPARAVVYRSEVTGVYVVDDQERVWLRRIRTGHETEAGLITVLAGLDAGERLALDPIEAGAKLKSQRSERAHD